MNKIRVSIETEEGTRYSWLENDRYWDEGEFEARYGISADYTAEDMGDSSKPIYGILEALGQNENCPPFLWTETFSKGSIEWLGES